MQSYKSCFGTGHRNIPEDGDLLEKLGDKIRYAILKAISEGHTEFYGSVDYGADQMFLAIALDLRRVYTFIHVHAVIPYRELLGVRDVRFLAGQCDTSIYLSINEEQTSWQAVQQYMAHRCERLIAVYDGRRSGGTERIIRYCRSLDMEIVEINPRLL